MFYQMITRKRDKWLKAPDSTITDLIRYIEIRGQMRDAQIEAIKTYLFLKIACDNKPLWELFASGAFNSIDLNNFELKPAVTEYLKNNSAALALFEYSTMKNDKGEQVSEKLENLIRSNPESIDFEKAIKDFFYGVSYTDYVFSLPMGAGKTYLMAAFIYLDLYFAQSEPLNQAFAHNFIIFAPSGLKSSVIPSLKTIENFDPSWIIPEPAASNLKRSIHFEVLDQAKSAKKSNKAKNPNVQKIASYQPFDSLMGLVVVTNAEKVILDDIKVKGGQVSFLDDDETGANELRKRIGQVPRFSIFVDEVHHAAADEVKLRAVINEWNKQEDTTVTSVIGFSGTPYLDSVDPVSIGLLSIKNIELSNVVYYYPLINGIGNFLKRPLVFASDNPNSMEIVAKGVREFLDKYKNTVYAGGLTAKLAIYCGQIVPLEEDFLPLVNEIVTDFGLNPNEAVLKYYGQDSTCKYSCPAENAVEFSVLDSPISKKRVILLAQIGKEGWDCRSLTGVVLSQKGACPTNMVLQTSCRCLRQVEKGQAETACIWLNKFNAETLEEQLQKQQHISIHEFTKKGQTPEASIERFDRRDHLHLPPVDFYQLKVQYNSVSAEEPRDTTAEILVAADGLMGRPITTVKDFTGKVHDTRAEDVPLGEPINYQQWLYLICKESFNSTNPSLLSVYKEALIKVFEQITVIDNGIRRYRGDCDQVTVRSRIRVALSPKTLLQTTEDVIRENVTLLYIKNFTSPYPTTKPDEFYPLQPDVKKVIIADNGNIEIDPRTQAAIDALKAAGKEDVAQTLINENTPLPEREKTYHYLPYHFGSPFEKLFFKELVTISVFKDKGLEVYYNGDRSLTDFRIRCYKGGKGNWRYIGQYTPDFLIVSRKDEQIFKAIIVETKGEGYAENFKDKRAFMDTAFKDLNTAKYGYNRYDYLYLEDSLSENARINKTITAINNFFGEDQ